MDIAAAHDFFSNGTFAVAGFAIPNYLPPIALTLLALLVIKRPASALYVGLIPLINWSFAHVPTFPIAEGLGGGVFQPLAVVTGLVLVVRDFAQRELGHWVFAAMAVGLLFSAMTTPLAIVAASGIAFLISEIADWAVYTFTKRPLSQRVLLSSAIGAPLESVEPILRLPKLERLRILEDAAKLAPLRRHPSLRMLSGEIAPAPYRPAADFWRELDKGAAQQK
jgi:hypothetical protein